MKSSIIFVALFSVAFAADFKLIGQDEILEFIQNRWDIDNFDSEVPDETLGNSLREILVTDLDTVDTGDVEFESHNGSAKASSAKVAFTSDLTTTTTVSGANKTESRSADRKREANLQVAVVRGRSSDTVFVNGTASGSVNAKSSNGTLSLTRDVVLKSQINTVRVGHPSDLKAHPIYREYHELIRMDKEANHHGSFISAMNFKSDRNVTTTVGNSTVKSIEKTGGNVLITRVPQGISVTSKIHRFMAVEDSKKPPFTRVTISTTLIN